MGELPNRFKILNLVKVKALEYCCPEDGVMSDEREVGNARAAIDYSGFPKFDITGLRCESCVVYTE